MSLIFAVLLAQVGPFATPGQPRDPLPPELQDRKARPAVTAPPAPPPPAPPAVTQSDDLRQCLADLRTDPLAALEKASSWMEKSEGVTRAEAGQCLGLANSRLERFDEAQAAFEQALEALPTDDHARRARLGALAGNAALARGDAAQALALLDAGQFAAQAEGNSGLAALIQIDRARALVPQGRQDEAAAALAVAREALPGNAQAWLLSATLSRRMDKLADAQAQIERAAALQPVDPEIGLEAGVIAMLAGREDAARKSWQSVVDAAPGSDAAKTAQGYLAQLGNPAEEGA
ncbi:MAG: hypothetical protein KDE55_23875 [Novosphingobium sp.]|nr:hypothetical protein [Novosphingobium sp.]